MSTPKINRHMGKAMHRGAVVEVVNYRVLSLNIILAVAALGLLAYYVVQANTLAAFQYDLSAFGDDVMTLREEHHALGAEVADQEHPDRIAAFARSAGMVLASDATYVSIPESPLAGR